MQLIQKMDDLYCGIGSKYYDMVTEQMKLTVSYAKPMIRKMVEDYEIEKSLNSNES